MSRHDDINPAWIVAAVLVALVVLILLGIAGLWLWNESLTYRGNGTMQP